MASERAVTISALAEPQVGRPVAASQVGHLVAVLACTPSRSTSTGGHIAGKLEQPGAAIRGAVDATTAQSAAERRLVDRPAGRGAWEEPVLVSRQGGRGERTPPRHELAHVAGERRGELERRVAEPQCDASLLDLQVVDGEARRGCGAGEEHHECPGDATGRVDADIVRRKARHRPAPKSESERPRQSTPNRDDDPESMLIVLVFDGECNSSRGLNRASLSAGSRSERLRAGRSRSW
jgi:hypothetical protein